MEVICYLYPDEVAKNLGGDLKIGQYDDPFKGDAEGAISITLEMA